jgi:tetratricopeptide (TPR) repeat protein
LAIFWGALFWITGAFLCSTLFSPVSRLFPLPCVLLSRLTGGADAASAIMKMYETAADYTQALRVDPNLAAAYTNRGNAYSNKGMYDRAIADLNQALMLDPNYTKAYNSRGVAYYNKRMYDRAIADFEAALRINPDDTTARKNLEVARRARGW